VPQIKTRPYYKDNINDLEETTLISASVLNVDQLHSKKERSSVLNSFRIMIIFSFVVLNLDVLKLVVNWYSQ
jgi:hypothetical protein